MPPISPIWRRVADWGVSPFTVAGRPSRPLSSLPKNLILFATSDQTIRASSRYVGSLPFKLRPLIFRNFSLPYRVLSIANRKSDETMLGVIGVEIHHHHV